MYRVTITVDRSRAYTRKILAGIVRYSKLHGRWELYGQPRHFVRPMPDIRTWDGDGAIVMAATDEWLVQLREVRCPIVNVSARFQHVGFPTVVPDNFAVGRCAAAHLIERGFKHFAYFGPADHGYSIERHRGVLAETEPLGLTCVRFEHPKIEPSTWNAHVELLGRWARRLPLPIAIICANDDMAMLLLTALAEAGLRCPEDVAVIGADNDALAGELSVPSLSSVDVNAFQVGFQAARLLDRFMRGSLGMDTSPVLIPPAGVIARQSTDVVATADELTRRALAFIRKSYHDRLSVDRLVDHLGCSRRAIELRFQQQLDRSPADEIRRVQIEAAKRMLVETDLPLEDVAERSGIGSMRQLAILFKKYVHIPPSEYRQKHLVVVGLD